MFNKAPNTSEVAKYEYDKSSRNLSLLSVGTSVWIQNPINRLWDRIGVIEGIRNTDRSFIVNIPGGRSYVRNRRFLRPVAKVHDSMDCVQMLKQDIPNQPL
eukprot:TCALIF_12080-PA protein Name:"Protein of unknown function" AED:0.36 eAED:0.50 QI:76/0/0/1/0/0/2/0/100